jgi:O-succinylbenzoic acid--CoA ligase
VDHAESKISKTSSLPWEIHFYQFILDWLSNSDFISIKTSGSTGAAKLMKVEKEKMIKSAQLTGQFFNLQKNNIAMLCLPVEFIAGKMMVIRAFALGLNLIPVEPSGYPMKGVTNFFDFAAMTPMQVYNTMKLEGGHQKLNLVKKLIIGGGEINQHLLKKIRKLDNDTYHTYGMTETLTHVALKKLNGKNPDAYFVAIPGVTFEKNDRDCLVISAPHVSNTQIRTNDIVDLKNNHSFNFIGRFDNVINSGGIKISPETIESKLSSIIQNRYIIAGFADNQLGQKVILIIEGKEKFFIDYARVGLSEYEMPKQVYFLDHFPETENGKIIRHEVIKSLLRNSSDIHLKA